MGYEPVGIFKHGQEEFPAQLSPVVLLFATVGLLCNDASLERDEAGWRMRGDPTEGALVVLGIKAGLDPGQLAADYPRLEEDSLLFREPAHDHHTPSRWRHSGLC